MKILIAKHSGFCYGVKRAIDLALACNAATGKVATLGPIIHNPQMVAHLSDRGIDAVDNLDAFRAGDTVIFRSHGVGPEIYSAAAARGLTVVDATCPHVRKAQLAAQKLSAQGYHIMIIGERNHPEVKSIAAWSGKHHSIVETVEEAEALPALPRVGVVAQTTFSGSLFETILAIVVSKAAEIQVERTICNATDLRQTETLEIAKKADVMIIVGGRNSANTARLAEISRSVGCPAYHIETADELDPAWFADIQTAGITAGASTPSWLIEEVYRRMQDFNQEMTPVLPQLETGAIVKGKVVGVRKDEVFVDIGYKAEGIIPLAELAYPTPETAADVVAEGDVIDVYVMDADSAEGNIKLSKKEADKIVVWDKLAASLEKKSPIEVKVTEPVKGGVAVSVFGLRGFIPASQLDLRFVEDLSVFKGQTVKAIVIDLDRDKQRVVLSRRLLLEKERQEREEQVYGSITPGTVIKGRITRLADFGAFADIGGVEGLIHLSDLSWERVKNPAEVVAVGDEVEVHVLKVDPKAKRISLSLKQSQQDPWFDKTDELRVGQIITGKVTKTSKFGAFVEVAKGIEGLVHISEIADRRVATADEVVHPAQEVQVKIVSLDKQTKKIGLSIKQAQEETERAEYQQYLSKPSSLSVSLADKLGHLLKRED
ncbi:MAG: bifunctional 4-hydroxy-3-methylbut-2-enyl diphosphate reductase/30S ribosomal protein S1 [Negativicutes bacterium]|nr:bifunctional 4-hydroxy-3-methylbut-2-enyl diphosphate reductase/30S ribosomal protein S1 [Negativicutes bacterium]